MLSLATCLSEWRRERKAIFARGSNCIQDIGDVGKKGANFGTTVSLTKLYISATSCRVTSRGTELGESNGSPNTNEGTPGWNTTQTFAASGQITSTPLSRS